MTVKHNNGNSTNKWMFYEAQTTENVSSLHWSLMLLSTVCVD